MKISYDQFDTVIAQTFEKSHAKKENKQWHCILIIFVTVVYRQKGDKRVSVVLF